MVPELLCSTLPFPLHPFTTQYPLDRLFLLPDPGSPFSTYHARLHCFHFHLPIRLDFHYLFLFHFNLGGKSLRECSQVGREKDAMGPARLFAPETSKVVPNGVISSLGQALMFALAEFVVSLGNLPH
jgi:hypothetical protein